MCITHSLTQGSMVWVIHHCVLQYLLQQKWVFHQSAPGQVKEAPHIQFTAEGRFLAQLQEVVYSLAPPLVVQQGLGRHLIAAVCLVGLEMRNLQRFFFIIEWNKRVIVTCVKESNESNAEAAIVNYLPSRFVKTCKVQFKIKNVILICTELPQTSSSGVTHRHPRL